MQIVYKRYIPLILLSAAFLLSLKISSNAQNNSTQFNASLSLYSTYSIKDTLTGEWIHKESKLEGPFVYGEKSLQIRMKIEDKQKKFYFCYVLHFTEKDSIVKIIYPGAHDVNGIDNKFPKYKSGKIIMETNLLDFYNSPQFIKDNLILLMTERPIDLFTRQLIDLWAFGIRPIIIDPINKEELMLLIKGSKLSNLFAEAGNINLKTLQIETRPWYEQFKSVSGFQKQVCLSINPITKKMSCVINTNFCDSNEVETYTPPPELIIRAHGEGKDIWELWDKDSFPAIDIISPDIGIDLRRGAVAIKEKDAKKLLIRGIAQDWNRAIKNITVNGNPANTYRKESGYFDYLYELKDCINTVDVTAENMSGFKKMKRFRFIYEVPEEKISKPGRNYLIVIGINDYKDNGWPKLNNAVKDAQDFEKLMIEKYGYLKADVIELFNELGTRKRIFKELNSMKDSLSNNDRLLIYYAGHGYYDKKLELGYWIPVDAKAYESDEYLNYLEIARLVQKMNAKNIFLIADACFSGSLLRDMQKENNHDYKSRMVLCSGKLQPVSDGTPGTNSPFAAVILNYLNDANIGEVLATNLIHFLKDRFKDSEQKPVGGALDDVGDENGDFVLEKRL